MIDRFGTTRRVALALFLLASAAGLVACLRRGRRAASCCEASVRSGNAGLAGYTVSLYQNFVDRTDGWEFVGSSVTDANGDFQMFYDVPSERSVLIVQADRGPVTLASAISYSARTRLLGSSSTSVPLSRWATRSRSSSRAGAWLGNSIVMIDAVRMAGNLAHPGTGDAGAVVSRTPNGSETSTFATLNSLANAVAACVAKDSACLDLFNAGRPPSSAAPDNVLQAVANIRQVPRVSGLSQRPAGSRIPVVARRSGVPASPPPTPDQLAPVPQDHRRLLQRAGQQQSHERPRQFRHR